MNLNWEITFLLVTIPIYLIGMAAVILTQVPIRYRPLVHAAAEGNVHSSTEIWLKVFPNGIIYSALFLHALALITRGLRAGHFPVTNIYESLLFFAFVIILSGMVSSKYKHIPFINVGAIPVGVILLIVALFRVQEVESLAPALQSYWLSIHVGFAFMSYAVYTVAFIAGVFYIFLDRQMKKKKFGLLYQLLPPLEALDEINYYSVALGFVLLTIGIITGSIWANETWGRYWGWDSKETWSLATWLLYAILLHVRVTSKIRGRKIAYLSILGFGFIIFTYLGVGLLLPGLHSYLSK